MGFYTNPLASGSGFTINSNHVFVNETARDDYFNINPEEKVVGVLISVGIGYQEWNGTEWVDKTAIIAGTGRVSSVNGRTDTVVLTANDIDYDESNTIKQVGDDLKSRTTVNEGNITTAQSNISNIQDDVSDNTTDIISAQGDITTLQSNEGKVKVDSDDSLQYLENKVDNSTIQSNVGKKLVAKSLDGLQATIIELNRLQGIEGNVQAQFNALSNIGNFSGTADTYADIATSYPSPSDKDMVIVLADETQGGVSTVYLYSETASDWQFTGTFTATVRDFSTDPLNLATETTGILSEPNIDSDIARQSSVTALESDVSDLQDDSHIHTNKATLDTYNQTNANITDAVSKKHEHTNKATLDTYTQTEANLSDAVSKKHEHINKDTIDKFDETVGGNLLYNGEQIYTGDVPQLPDIEYGDANKIILVSESEDGFEYKEFDIDNIDASKITSGVFSIARIPHAALERLVIVADTPARLALTTATVQNGDTVKENDTQLMYFVIDDTKLNIEDGYLVYTAGHIDWSNVENNPIPDIEYGDDGKLLKANESTGEFNLIEKIDGTMVEDGAIGYSNLTLGLASDIDKISILSEQIKVKKDLTLLSASWADDTTISGYWIYTVADTDVDADTVVDVNIQLGSLSNAEDLLSVTVSGVDEYKLYATFQPNEALSYDVKLIKQGG